MTMRLHGYWRSSAAYRLRCALNYKGLAVEHVPHNLRAGEQRAGDYLKLAPQGLVPALEVDGMVLTQSSAIIEWVEERWPEPPLLPAELFGRAIVRSMAALIACDIHPINNLRVLTALRSDFLADEKQVAAWISRWISEGFKALDVMIARHGNGFAYGDTPTIADCHLVPQIYGAERFGVDLTPYPALKAAGERAMLLSAFADAHPDRQPDADRARG